MSGATKAAVIQSHLKHTADYMTMVRDMLRVVITECREGKYEGADLTQARKFIRDTRMELNEMARIQKERKVNLAKYDKTRN